LAQAIFGSSQWLKWPILGPYFSTLTCTARYEGEIRAMSEPGSRRVTEIRSMSTQDQSSSEHSVELVDAANLLDLSASSRMPEDILKEHKLWDGWGAYYDAIPLGPDQKLALPKTVDKDDQELVGFAFPLAPVEFQYRNERKYPPPTEDQMFREMYKLIQFSLKKGILKRSYALSLVYEHINRNKRDSDGWQRGFIKAGGIQKLKEFWHNPDNEDTSGGFPDRYWVLAIFGRMLGTCKESRIRLIKEDVHKIILAGAKDLDEDIWSCALCGLKGLIQHNEGRKEISYNMLIDVMGRGR